MKQIQPGTVRDLVAGTSPLWELPVAKFFMRVGAFFYFLIKENLTRARAETGAVTNLRSPEGWLAELQTAGFSNIRIHKLRSKYRWIPEPLSIQALNLLEEEQ